MLQQNLQTASEENWCHGKHLPSSKMIMQGTAKWMQWMAWKLVGLLCYNFSVHSPKIFQDKQKLYNNNRCFRFCLDKTHKFLSFKYISSPKILMSTTICTIAWYFLLMVSGLKLQPTQFSSSGKWCSSDKSSHAILSQKSKSTWNLILIWMW